MVPELSEGKGHGSRGKHINDNIYDNVSSPWKLRGLDVVVSFSWFPHEMNQIKQSASTTTNSNYFDVIYFATTTSTSPPKSPKIKYSIAFLILTLFTNKRLRMAQRMAQPLTSRDSSVLLSRDV